MAWYNDDDLRRLNFIVTGNRQAGCRFLQNILAKTTKIASHIDLLHENDEIRKAAHHTYFGDTGRIITHYVPCQISVEQYLNNKVFDNPRNDEEIIGIKVNYPTISRNDLWDYLDQKTRRGDFCVIHLVRNPVACYVLWKLQQPVEVDSLSFGRTNKKLYIDPQELTEFVREHEAVKAKINRFCTDRLVITYPELLFNLRQTVERIFEFLELSFDPIILPKGVKYRYKEIRSQVLNWMQLKDNLPPDVLPFLTCPGLI